MTEQPDVLVERLAARTVELCEIPSPITEEKRLADFIEGWSARLFPKSDRLRISHSLVLGSLADPRPTVALLGHLDTVPAHPTDGPPRKEGDRIVGLGSSDMKGGLAVMMALAEDLDRAKLSFNLVFIFYEREEGTYAESGLKTLLEQVQGLKRIQFGIALEPTDNVVQVGCVGSLQATLRLSGKSAHSARPWQGENAIHKAGPLLAELLAMQRREVSFGGHRFYEVMSITLAKGGRAKNVVPDSLELNLNYRFAPGKTPEQAEADVREWLRGRAQLEIGDVSPAGKVDANHPLFLRLVDRTGLRTEPKQAWTDVGRLSAHGIAAVNFGPGETAQAHQAQESASASALAVAYRKLESFLT